MPPLIDPQSQRSFSKVTVLGAGSWGTALAVVLQTNGIPTTVWGQDPAAMAQVRDSGENAPYLPGVRLPAGLTFTSDFDAAKDADLLLLAVPSRAIREVAGKLAASGIREGAVLLSGTKGVERGSGLRMSEVVAEFFSGHAVGVLSGPSHAEEVARGLPTAVVVGCHDAGVAARLQQAFSTATFRAYTSHDVPGIELGGALKNVFALAAGVSDGLGLGDNAKASLITRALSELVRLGTALGGEEDTFQGLSGVGDLMVTCFSAHSRNRMVGERLGRGEALAAIIASMRMVAEGVPTTHSVWECARKFGVKTPIVDQMHALLEATTSPRRALENLLSREPRPER